MSKGFLFFWHVPYSKPVKLPTIYKTSNSNNHVWPLPVNPSMITMGSNGPSYTDTQSIPDHLQRVYIFFVVFFTATKFTSKTSKLKTSTAAMAMVKMPAPCLLW